GGRVDALDTRGSWRLVDALRAFAFDGSAEGRTVALDGGKDALDLGTWSDGTPLRAPPSTWDSSAPHEGLAQWKCGGMGEAAMRRLLAGEQYSRLALPDPAHVDAARLPASDRLMAKPPEPPSGGWPESVRKAMENGAALLL